jgi:NAD(P)H-quinone oxidoreductase subunit 5
MISRAGDVALVAGIALTYGRFQTLDLAELFQAVSMNAGTVPGKDISLAAIGCWFVAAATLKSAQFPFHSWLPLTMETPTPVSALMHAGIVNAGGYLMIRMSPILAQAPEALAALAWIGAVTAVIGSLSMMTQNSIKQSLAYSTIAQMGFMMLQCGLGAFTAAMYHLVAHSLYKAYAFLSTGSVVAESAARQGATRSEVDLRRSWIALTTSVVLATISYLVIFQWWLAVDRVASPGVGHGSHAWIFGVTLCLAMATWGWNALTLGANRNLVATSLGIGGLCLVYVVGYLAIEGLVGSTMPRIALVPAATVVVGFVLLAFCSLFALHLTLLHGRSPRWLQALRVHAANGFYVDAMIRRLAQQIAN